MLYFLCYYVNRAWRVNNCVSYTYMFLKFFVIRWFYIYTPEIIQLYQWFLSPLAGIRKCPWKYLLCVSLSVLLILAVVGLLLWYFCKWIGRFFLDSLNDFCHCMDLVWWSSSCVCVCMLQYTTSVYWGSRAEVVTSVLAPPNGVMVSRTVLMETMNLIAVRPSNQHTTPLTHAYCICFLASYQWPAWWLNSIVLSESQSASTGPTSCCKVTPLTARSGCRYALKAGTTTMGGLCVSTWDTRGADCLLPCLFSPPPLPVFKS